MIRTYLRAFAVVLAFVSYATAQSSSSVLGLWREPGGSVIDVHPCGSEICARLAYLPPSAPTRLDANNPNSSQRSRPLCGLQIGWGFHPADREHATDGYIYDPRNGSSYHGALSADGDTLRLRGWAGFKIFSRTETWTRLTRTPPPCHA